MRHCDELFYSLRQSFVTQWRLQPRRECLWLSCEHCWACSFWQHKARPPHRHPSADPGMTTFTNMFTFLKIEFYVKPNIGPNLNCFLFVTSDTKFWWEKREKREKLDVWWSLVTPDQVRHPLWKRAVVARCPMMGDGSNYLTSSPLLLLLPPSVAPSGVKRT